MIFATLSGLLYWRYSKPEVRSSVTTPIALPVSMLVYVAALIALTVRRQFWDSVVGLGIVLTGFPVYYLFLAREGEEEMKEREEERNEGNEKRKGQKVEGGGKKRRGKTRIDGEKTLIAFTRGLQILLGVVEQEEDGERKRN